MTMIKCEGQVEFKVVLQNQKLKSYVLLLVLLHHLSHQQVICKIQVFLFVSVLI